MVDARILLREPSRLPISSFRSGSLNSAMTIDRNRSGQRTAVAQVRMPVGFIFDGDDTLWATQALYVRAKQRFYKTMEHLGFDRLDVDQRFERIDVDNV